MSDRRNRVGGGVFVLRSLFFDRAGTGGGFGSISARMTGVRLASVLSASFETFFPCLCLHCGEPVGGDRVGLCDTCWTTVIPHEGQPCPRCGGPSAGDPPLCLSCQSSPPPQSGTILWGEYDGALRSAILALKKRGHDPISPHLARRLSTRIAAEGWTETVDTVTHVPSHRFRTVRLGWSAAACLAHDVARELGVPAQRMLRRRGLARQTGRTRAQRMGMSRHSFSCRRPLDGRHVLIIDDVATTGTTLRRVAEVLLLAGSEIVYCAAMAATPDARRVT